MDMNLVKVFVAIYEQKSVSGAANILNITQPSVSYALKKMRDELNDELFIRQNTSMEPTQQAIQIYYTFSRVLREIDSLVNSRKSFNYLTSSHKFVLAMSDLGEHYYLPLIFREINKIAPNIQIEVIPLEIMKLQEWLDKGIIDAAICNKTYHVSNIHYDIILQDQYVCLKGKSHSRIGDKISLKQFLYEKHIVASSQTGHNFYQNWASSTGNKLIKPLIVPNLNIVAPLVESTDCISVVPETYSILSSKLYDVSALLLPIEFPKIEICIYTQKNLNTSNERLWFFEILKDICVNNNLIY